MTALTEDELDLVFESFTQKNNMDSLDGYFAEGTKAGGTACDGGTGSSPGGAGTA